MQNDQKNVKITPEFLSSLPPQFKDQFCAILAENNKLKVENLNLNNTLDSSVNELSKLEKKNIKLEKENIKLTEMNMKSEQKIIKYKNIAEAAEKELKEIKSRLNEYLTVEAYNFFVGKKDTKVNIGSKKSTIPSSDIPKIKKANKRPKKYNKSFTIDGSEPKKVTEEYVLKEEERICDCCGKPMRQLPPNEMVQIAIDVANVFLKIISAENCVCEHCSKNSEKANFVQAIVPKQPLPGTKASASILSYIIYSKFFMANPLHRLEKFFKTHNFNISRSTMSNWLMSLSELVKPLYKLILSKLLEESYLLIDETPYRVTNGKKGKGLAKTTFVWTLTNGKKSEIKATAFVQKESRSAQALKEIVEGYTGTISCDGYSAYKTLKDKLVIVGCLAHARRKFTDAMKATEFKSENARKGVDYFDKIFEIERKMDKEEYSIEEIVRTRQEQIQPILKELKGWCEQILQECVEQSYLGKACTYFINQFEYIYNYTTDGTYEGSTNSVERKIKKYKIGSKNFLFSVSNEGAEVNAMFYTLVQSAEDNKLNLIAYFEYALNMLANIDGDINKLEELLPWNKEIIEKFGIKKIENLKKNKE